MKHLLLLPASLLCAVILSSCTLVWGSSYQVVYSNSEGMLVQYDPLLASPSTLAGAAQAEASKYGRVIVPGNHEPSHYSGIHQRYYKFIKPSAQGRSEY